MNSYFKTFPNKIMYTFLISPTHAACLAYLILLDLITTMLFYYVEHKLKSFALRNCLKSFVSSTLSVSNKFLRNSSLKLEVNLHSDLSVLSHNIINVNPNTYMYQSNNLRIWLAFDFRYTATLFIS